MIGSCDICNAQDVPVSKVTAAGGIETVACYPCQGDVPDPYGEMSMNADQVKVAMDKLRAEASRGPVSSALVFALTDPIMDAIAREAAPKFWPCCGYPYGGEHNSSCSLYATQE